MSVQRIQRLIVLTMIFGATVPGIAQAQSSGEDLLSLGDSSLRSELGMRYDAGLAATRDPAIVAADDARFLWASETKVQCGIAIGYMKSSTRDETSIRKCGDAYARLIRTQVAPPPVESKPDVCNQKVAGIVFFEFDSSTPPAEAAQTIDFVANNVSVCGWDGFLVAGHTDRAGSNSYNQALSIRRAEAVASIMASRGISRDAISVSAFGEEEPRVETPDGERNPQNRRVEITVN